MWLYRLGLTRAKEFALTGKPLTGIEATSVGLINSAVPFPAGGGGGAGRLATDSASQLAAMKLVVNQAYENMGLASTQTLGPILDGLMRNTPGRAPGDRARRGRWSGGARRRAGPCVGRLLAGTSRRAAGPGAT